MPTAIAERAAQRMEFWCGPAGNLGYGQGSGIGGRWDIRVGGAADCSSLVAFCYNEAGITPKFPQDGRTYTGTYRSLCLARGFAVVSHPLQRGDICLNERNHVAMYLGGGKLGQASINEKGGILGGLPGDQTGYETNIKAFYDYPWNLYLRHVRGDQAATTNTVKREKTLLEKIGDMKATHILFQIDSTLYIADVLAGTYRAIPNPQTLNDMCTVIGRAGGSVKYWQQLGAASNKVSNPAAFGRRVG